MENFTYWNPTRIVFGKGTIPQLKDLIPESCKVLITYGGGSIKANGVYDQVRSALAGRTVEEFGGIEPNPCYETLMKAVELGRASGTDFLLAVGGGSVLDGTKFIAAAIPHAASDPWDILTGKVEVADAVPLGSVLTLPATGSEMNKIAVISRESTNEKLVFVSDHVYPQFSILDPETTYSLPPNQVRNGIVDTFIHVTEQYLTCAPGAPLQDRQAEGILLTLLDEGPKAMQNHTDYDARANLVWCATQALNGLIGCGVGGCFATHMIGHELTAFFGLAHAESLAVVLPSLLRRQKEHKKARLLQFAARVWGIENADSDSAIEEAVVRTETFFQSLGMPTRLSEVNVSCDDAAKRVSARFKERDTVLAGDEALDPDGVAEILRMSG